MESNTAVNLDQLHKTVEELFEYATAQGQLARENLHREHAIADADEVERTVHRKLMTLGQGLMQQYFKAVGTGDRGYRIEVNGAEYVRGHRQRFAKLLTVFGPVPYQRSEYYSADGQCVIPFNAMANLAAAKTTYFVQDLMSRLGIEQTYLHSRDFYEQFFGHSPSSRTVRETIVSMTRYDDAYQGDRPVPDTQKEGKIGVVTFDAKGIRVVRSERTTGKTREALLGCVYTVNEQVRQSDLLARALVRPDLLKDDDKTALTRTEHGRQMRYFGSLTSPKATVFEEASTAAEKRFHAAGIKQVACLMDGAPGLWRLAKKFFPKATYILDIIHVIEYLWLAARAVEKPREPARELVCAYLTTILNGNAHLVIRGLRVRLARNKFSKKKREDIEKAITYFENHLDYMRYDVYLSAGLPIATGVIESACRHIIKDRMDKSGALWTLDGAESVVKLRCVRANDDWQLYQNIRKQKERTRLYANLIDNYQNAA